MSHRVRDCSPTRQIHLVQLFGNGRDKFNAFGNGDTVAKPLIECSGRDSSFSKSEGSDQQSRLLIWQTDEFELYRILLLSDLWLARMSRAMIFRMFFEHVAKSSASLRAFSTCLTFQVHRGYMFGLSSGSFDNPAI